MPAFPAAPKPVPHQPGVPEMLTPPRPLQTERPGRAPKPNTRKPVAPLNSAIREARRCRKRA
jgi:hypothetical protein